MKWAIKHAIVVSLVILYSCTPGVIITGDPRYEERPLALLGIPKGHLPPPGECRIWYPDLPAGRQPPPQSCPSAIATVPLGVWLITHTSNENQYRVDMFDKKRNGKIIQTVYYR